MEPGTPRTRRRLPAAPSWLPDRSALPGLAAASALAGLATVVAALLPAAVGAVPLAVVLGLLIGRWLRWPVLQPGYALASGSVLRIGIVLLGAQLSLAEIVRVGVPAIGLVLAALLIAAVVVWSVARWLGVEGPLVVLLGVGSAVCGNTAILAVAPAVRAGRREVALAVAGVTLWGTLALLVYPLVGRAVGLGEVDFGLWAGLAIQDTSQVVAAGAAYSDDALRVATVVKLVRNGSLLLVLPLVARLSQRGVEAPEPVGLRDAVPVFVIGFLAMAVLRSVGIIDAELAARLGRLSGWAVLVAVAGLGLGIELGGLGRGAGRALTVAAITAAVLGIFGLSVALLGVVAPR